LRKDVQRREQAAAALPGGAAEHPIDVATPAVIEVKARATPCPQCGGELQLEGDRAHPTPRGLLRELAVSCRLCHARRALWFRVTPGGPN
jgi:hypothetical protein